MDYKLSPNVNKRIKRKWKKDDKNRLKFTAYETQAGSIINKWARKRLEYKRNLKEKDASSKVRRKLGHNSYRGKKIGETNGLPTDEKEQRHQMLLVNAKTIWGIINGVKEEVKVTDHHGASCATKNRFDWKNESDGGEQFYNENIVNEAL